MPWENSWQLHDQESVLEEKIWSDYAISGVNCKLIRDLREKASRSCTETHCRKIWTSSKRNTSPFLQVILKLNILKRKMKFETSYMRRGIKYKKIRFESEIKLRKSHSKITKKISPPNLHSHLVQGLDLLFCLILHFKHIIFTNTLTKIINKCLMRHLIDWQFYVTRTMMIIFLLIFWRKYHLIDLINMHHYYIYIYKTISK